MAAVAIGGAAIFGTGMVFAQSSNNPESGLVQAIAQKFNLDQTQVQGVFDQFRSTQKANMTQKMQQMEDQRLTNLVTQGKITNDQKTAIETELAALKAKYLANLGSLTPDQRKQAMQNYQNDLKSWASSQGIDQSLLAPKFDLGMGRRGFGKGWHNMSPKPSASPTT